jgi:hypothetical protein
VTDRTVATSPAADSGRAPEPATDHPAAEQAAGWVEVRLIGPKPVVKDLARLIGEGREKSCDSGTQGPRRDGKYARSMTVRLRPAEAAQRLSQSPLDLGEVTA